MLTGKNAFHDYMDEVNSVMKSGPGGGSYGQTGRMSEFRSNRSNNPSTSPRKIPSVFLTNLTDFFSQTKMISEI